MRTAAILMQEPGALGTGCSVQLHTHTLRHILEAKRMPLPARTLLNQDLDYIFCFAVIL